MAVLSRDLKLWQCLGPRALFGEALAVGQVGGGLLSTARQRDGALTYSGEAGGVNCPLSVLALLPTTPVCCPTQVAGDRRVPTLRAL